MRWTIDRKTGVVMAEDVHCSMDHMQLLRSFKGESPKEVLTVFFSWEETPTVHAMSVTEPPGNKHSASARKLPPGVHLGPPAAKEH